LVRQFFPEKPDLSKVTFRQFLANENKLNLCPNKRLGFHLSFEGFLDQTVVWKS
jgi:IS30 family transposase